MTTQKDTTQPLDDYRRLAPSVEKDWLDSFVLEQRLLGVPGDRIGDAIAVIESHVTESGESAREAFGNPEHYARESASGTRDDTLDLSWILGTGLGLVGMLLTVNGFTDWILGDGSTPITIGSLVLMTMVLAGLALLTFRSGPVLRFVVNRPWLSIGIFTVQFAVVVLAVVVLPQVLLTVPAILSFGLGIALLTAGTVMEWRSRSHGELDDPILGPGQQPARRAGTSWFARATLLLFPLTTLLLIAFSWLLNAVL